MSDDVVGRLRRTRVIGYTGGGSLSSDGSGTTYGEQVKALVNPDGPEAADTIERLRAELAAKVPEGYVVVPVEPTEAMWRAAEGCVDEMSSASQASQYYRAMIAANERERAMDELIAGDSDLIDSTR